MKRKLNKRAVALLVCLVILVAVSVGVTLAYLFTESNSVENTFAPAKVSCDVVETFEGNMKEDVRIQNTGNTDAYIRAAIVVTWKNDADEVYAVAPVPGVDYSIDLNDSIVWLLGDDGFYYYNKDVAPVTECDHAADKSCANCCTDVLINSCSQKAEANVPAEYHLSVEIVASAIQSRPDSVVHTEWSNTLVTVTGNNGTLTVINKEVAT